MKYLTLEMQLETIYINKLTSSISCQNLVFNLLSKLNVEKKALLESTTQIALCGIYRYVSRVAHLKIAGQLIIVHTETDGWVIQVMPVSFYTEKLRKFGSLIAKSQAMLSRCG